ncbi:TonB family protein [uncultured Desulfobacter sp.]|uniref:energy transducer TonB n=1 Tax=uncultured Desulfobacter sp. TaxID=240139 RepID=UPI002AABF621|nr:TonB family protein [uncultured Desulfobacter sp.]
MTLQGHLFRLVTALAVTCLLNIMIFAGLPMLTRVTHRERPQSFDSPIMIASIKPPKPPEEIKQREIKERHMEQMKHNATPARAAKPKLAVSKFEFAADMSADIGGIAIGPAREIGEFKTEMKKIEFELTEVDTPPKATRKAPAMYPFGAKRKGIQGQVLIRCLVGLNGTATKHKILISEPEGEFDEAALTALQKWRFKPGILGGQAVPTWIRVPFIFKLN